MPKRLALTVLAMVFATSAQSQPGTDSQPKGASGQTAAPMTAKAAMGSDSNPSFPPGPIGLQALQPLSPAAISATATTVYFTPQDENTSTTALFLYNTNATPDTVALQTFYTNGSLTINTTIPIPALSLVRVCADPVSTVSASWAGATIVNFTTFSAYAKMTVPPGVKYSGYVVWDTTGTYDPLSSLEVLPLRFSIPAMIPATVYFTPQDENTNTTVLFLYNLNAVPATVGLQTFYTNGSLTVNTSIDVPALSMVRVCADGVSTTSASWAGATLVNLTTFSAYAKMTVPAGVLYDGYVAWNTAGVYDPLVVNQVLPLRFDSDVNVALSAPPPSPPGARPLRVMPNPSSRGSQVSFTLAGSEAVELTVYDAGGRLVQRLARGTLGAGEHTFAWDGRAASGGEAAAGIYFVRLHSASHDMDVKVVKIR